MIKIRAIIFLAVAAVVCSAMPQMQRARRARQTAERRVPAAVEEERQVVLADVEDTSSEVPIEPYAFPWRSTMTSSPTTRQEESLRMRMGWSGANTPMLPPTVWGLPLPTLLMLSTGTRLLWKKSPRISSCAIPSQDDLTLTRALNLDPTIAI